VLKRMEEVARVILAALWPGTMLKQFRRVAGVAALSTALVADWLRPPQRRSP